MKEIQWTVRYLGAPTAVRYCRHCGAEAVFASSGLFRVNAQQKRLDVWLIYKCRECSETWNLTLYSGVSPKALPRELLESFHRNDGELALRYASDCALLKRNGAKPGEVEAEILGESIDWTEPVRIELIAHKSSGLKAATAIRNKLGVSGAQFARLCDSGKLICISGQNLRKCKLSGTIIFEIR